MHCLIFQRVSTPDGLLYCIYGPDVGWWHDLTLLGNSGLEEQLSESILISGRPFHIFDAAAYVIRP